MSADEYATFSQRMKVGAYVRMRGDVVYDTYVNDYVFNANDIMADDEGVTVEREDNNPTPRVELHLHTVMSDMDALITVKQLIKTIKKVGPSGHCRHRPRARPVLPAPAGAVDGQDEQHQGYLRHGRIPV